MFSVLSAIGVWIIIGTPFLITMVAFLDVARRPNWAWALTGRRRTLWMALLGTASITWLGGPMVALWYFRSAYRDVRDAERGDIRFWQDPPSSYQPPDS